MRSFSFADHPVGDRLVDKEARAGAAHVPLVEEDPVHDALDGLVDRRVVEHDVRRLAAELHRHLAIRTRQLAHDRLADLRGAGEGDLRGRRVAHDKGTGLAGPRHEVHDAAGKAGVLEDLGKLEGGDRRRLRGLQDDAVSHRQRGRQLPREHEEREVPRDHLADDAKGRHRPARRHILQLVRPTRVVEEMGSRHRDIEVARLLDRLSAVDRLGDRELPRPVLQEASDAEEVLAPLPSRKRGPGPEGPPGGGIRGVHVGGSRERDLGELPLVGGVDGIEVLPRTAAGRTPRR